MCQLLNNMCRVLNMPIREIFVNMAGFYMRRDAIMIPIFQDSNYVGFLHMQALYRVLNIAE